MSIYREEITASAKLTDDNVSGQLVSDCADGMYMFIDRIEVSVYKASSSVDGILEILDSAGNWVWTLNVGSVKERQFEFGNEGLNVGMNTGIQALLSGASTQASVSIAVIYHLGVVH
jgi:hypothetical protein